MIIGATIDAKDVNCMGCKSEGLYFNHCNACEIRACATEKSIPNCGHCSDYACAKLTYIFKAVPAARDSLDAVKEARQGK